MGREKGDRSATVEPMTAIERLGLRVSAMIGSPKAQLERRAVIHRLDTDSDEAWGGIMAVLTDTDGLALTFDQDGCAVVTWEQGEVEETTDGREEQQPVEEEAPF